MNDMKHPFKRVSPLQLTAKQKTAKRLTVLVLCILAVSGALLRFDGKSHRAGAAAGGGPGVSPITAPTSGPSSGPLSVMTESDCSYLQDPESFNGLDGRHRIDLSRRTEQVSDLLDLTAGQLAAPQDIPRRNFIDNHIFDRMAQGGVQSAPLCTDEQYIRRVTLDLTGRTPSPEAVTEFLADTSANKRDTLVDNLIASTEFVDKWTLFYGDLYRNTAFASNIQIFMNGSEAFYKFIYDSIASNRPYNQIATEMIAGSGDSTVNGAVNFTVLGFVPMGPAQDTMDGQAVLTSTVFLGLSSMDCLLCHDGAGHLDAVNLWGSTVTRPQAWGMSAFYARTRRTFARPSTDVNYGVYTIGEGTTGEYTLNTNSGNRQTRAPIGTQSSAAPKYLFGTTTIGTSENRRQALARLMTADPQFARAAVNYIWEEMMVEALVSPSNTFDLARLDPNAKLPGGWTPQPNNPELLEALARDFMQNGFNLKRLIGQIAKSSTYQLSSSYPGTWKLDYVPYYARKYARRLDAEEIHDAIVQATGLPPLSQYREAGSTTGVNVFGFPILSDEGKLRRVVRWAGQLPDPAEPRTNFTARAFLDSFLRGNRDANLRSDDSSILQSLNLMNNTTITQRIRLDDRVTIGTETIRNTVYNLVNDRTLTDEKVIDRLYLLTLSRYPTAAEKSKLLPFFNWTPRQQAVESLQWVLLNKVDFIFNY